MKTIKWEVIRNKINGLGAPYQPPEAVVALLFQGEKEPAPDTELGYGDVCSLRDTASEVFGFDRAVEDIFYDVEAEIYDEDVDRPEQSHPVWGEIVMPGDIAP